MATLKFLVHLHKPKRRIARRTQLEIPSKSLARTAVVLIICRFDEHDRALKKMENKQIANQALDDAQVAFQNASCSRHCCGCSRRRTASCVHYVHEEKSDRCGEDFGSWGQCNTNTKDIPSYSSRMFVCLLQKAAMRI